MMMTLVTLPPAFGMRNISPFCLKAEMLLTSLDLPFELQQEKDPRKAPKGKLPYLIADGRRIADSELIAEYLDGITEGGVYGQLSAAQYAEGIALTRLVEDHLYWMIVASRWLDDAWFPNVVRDFFGFVPGVIRPLVAGSARRQVRRTYDLQGLGRHSLDEQRGFARRDLRALSAATPKQGFLGGDAPNVFDFTVAGMMAGLFDQQPTTWINEVAADFEDLRDHAERVQNRLGVFGRARPA